MHKITSQHSHPLYSTDSIRQIEQEASVALPPLALMQRAGLATARLALALEPHSRHIWIACGPGNNGGDGFEAALHLHRWGKRVTVTWTGLSAGRTQAPADAQASRQHAIAAGVTIADDAPAAFDLVIDALLGIGLHDHTDRPVADPLLRWLALMHSSPVPRLCVDMPSGLQANTGSYRFADAIKSIAINPRPICGNRVFTLTFLGLKPGLFTAQGRDQTGEVWLDDLGVGPVGLPPCALLLGGSDPALHRQPLRAHASHKGSFGDVAVIGGESAGRSHMVGAALLAASGALHAGAGRVFVALLGDVAQAGELAVDTSQPEFMFRAVDALDMAQQTVVCGCGGGAAVQTVVGRVLATASRAVLDADALNAIAADPLLQAALSARAGRGQTTVITPHPLEAARLVGGTAASVQQDRLGIARQMAEKFACVVVLKGSGTVICAPDQPCMVNHTGNALLATAGTGDVLAGMVGSGLARGLSALDAACQAVYHHGRTADIWHRQHAGTALTASRLARQLCFQD